MPIVRDRLLGLLGHREARLGEAVTLIESDPGLAYCVLRAGAKASGARVRIADIVERFAGMGLRQAVSELPTFDFFGGEAPRDPVMDTLRTHARATARIAEWIHVRTQNDDRDEIVAGALLHDIGRFSLAYARADYAAVIRARLTPERRLAVERSRFGVDHTAVGERVARDDELPPGVARIIARHHDEEARGAPAVVRLADLLAHHMAGSPVDKGRLGRAGDAVGLDAGALRSLLYELTQLGEPPSSQPQSPLSRRQRELLTLLSEGRTLSEAALALGVASTTLRSHLHLAYRKLGVNDRAQAVILARERGWLGEPPSASGADTVVA